jgi:hypothetical protein
MILQLSRSNTETPDYSSIATASNKQPAYYNVYVINSVEVLDIMYR